MKEKNNKDTRTGKGQEQHQQGRNRPGNPEEKIHHDPHADRSAKTSRKGAGQQQDSSGSPINS